MTHRVPSPLVAVLSTNLKAPSKPGNEMLCGDTPQASLHPGASSCSRVPRKSYTHGWMDGQVDGGLGGGWMVNGGMEGRREGGKEGKKKGGTDECI